MSVKLNIKTNSLKDLGLELREIRKKRKPKSNTTTSSNNVKSSNPYMSSYGYTSPNTSNVSSNIQREQLRLLENTPSDLYLKPQKLIENENYNFFMKKGRELTNSINNSLNNMDIEYHLYKIN